MTFANTLPRRWIWALALVGAGGVHAQAEPGSAVSGHWRGLWLARSAASAGPLAQAQALDPSLTGPEPSAAQAEAELRWTPRWGGLSGVAALLLQAQSPEGRPGGHTVRLHEAALSGGEGAWGWTVGKKVVSWDVGYAWRPNDLVQQEVRRQLAPTSLEGRPLALVEHFGADDAWSLVWAQPGRDSQRTGANEPALALRYYRRTGTADLYGFARWGAHTQGSLGAAGVWVASESLSLHGSWRAYQRADSQAAALGPRTLSPTNPWQAVTLGAGQQVLVGGTWTNDQQLSLLVEAWWDGTAPSPRQWRDWTARNQALPALVARGAPAAAVAGNLAWQTQALGTAANLHQRQWFTRLSWQHEGWTPALDLLVHPADWGRQWTAALAWQGDRVKLEAGLRWVGGPATAVLRQLPVQRQAYLAATWSF